MIEETAIRVRILDAAEARARAGGYHGFSFREIAEDVGIKSASVHYHFATKAALACALANRYTARACERLGQPAGLEPNEAIARVTALFRDALLNDDKMCLCGLFGAERDALPQDVAEATAGFFKMTLNFLQAVLGPQWIGETPEAILARLEGALIVSRVLRNPEVFEKAVAGLVPAS